jgi:hypothetical protein
MPPSDELEQLVRADDHSTPFAGRRVDGNRRVLGQVEHFARAFMGAQQRLDLGAQGLVLAAGPVQESRTLGGRRDFQGLREDRFFRQRRLGHD